MLKMNWFALLNQLLEVVCIFCAMVDSRLFSKYLVLLLNRNDHEMSLALKIKSFKHLSWISFYFPKAIYALLHAENRSLTATNSAHVGIFILFRIVCKYSGFILKMCMFEHMRFLPSKLSAVRKCLSCWLLQQVFP